MLQIYGLFWFMAGGSWFSQLSKMDDICDADACFEEDLFKLPLCHSKQTKEKRFSQYMTKLEPIYETHKVPKEEILLLECHTTHEIMPHIIDIPENDLLFHYFVELGSQDKKFMRTWLHLFGRWTDATKVKWHTKTLIGKT